LCFPEYSAIVGDTVDSFQVSAFLFRYPHCRESVIQSILFTYPYFISGIRIAESR
jgi:hypothetical protein